jgi:hypothetical protein
MNVIFSGTKGKWIRVAFLKVTDWNIEHFTLADTDNELNDENPEQYRHVTTVGPIGQPNIGLLRHLVNQTSDISGTKADSKYMAANCTDLVNIVSHP